ncbi:ABC transporter substrate-binding protein [Crossiella equi]|uniref:ABC transporter substrate-binding protein n=1 Tax=Crossiella equi TaxID=130796 RepID=UPI001B804AE5|nr:extracellular solute-binding protein [Crossiella equi]
MSACGLGGSGEQPASSPVTGEVKGNISFQTWNLKSKFGDYFNGLVSDFEKQHPGTKVEWLDQPADGYADKLSADASAGTLPDIMNLSPDLAYPLYQKNLLLDLDTAAPEAKKDYLPNAWDGYVMPSPDPAKRRNAAFPWYLNTGPYFYNKALFRENGLDENKPPKTYDDLKNQALTLASKAGGKVAMLGQTPGIEDFGLYGVPLMDSGGTKFTFNDAKGVQLVELYKAMYDAKALLPEALSATYTGSGAKFLAQQVALSSGSAYDLQKFRTDAPSLYANIGITEPMTNTGKANMYLQGLSIAQQSKNKPTAIAFARFVTSKASQLAFAKIVTVFPSTADTLNDPFFTSAPEGDDEARVRVAAAKQLGTAVNYTPVQLSDQMKTILRNEIANAMLGKQSAKQALDNAVSQCDKLLRPNG